MPRFSLRNLLIAVSLLGVLLGWIGRQIQQSREDSRLAGMCIELGATISYTGEEGGRVTEIAFGIDDPELNDEHLKQLVKLSRLRTICLQNTQVTGSGLAVLADFPALRVLHVNGKAHLTDEGMRNLKQLSNLEELRFWGARHDDPRVDEIQRALPHVRITR